MRYHYYTEARHTDGEVASGHTVTIYTDSAGATKASLFAASTGVTAVTNPITVPTTGVVDFWAAESKLYVVAQGETTVRPLYSAEDSDVFNVRDYGATGDGATDDTTAIAAALTAAASGGAVYLPAGSYVVSVTLTVPDNVTFYGDGPEVTTILVAASFTGSRVINLTGADNVCVRDLHVDHQSEILLYSVDAYNYTLTATTGVTVSNVKTTDGYCGVRVQNADKVFIEGCHIISGQLGMRFLAISNARIIGNFIDTSLAGMGIEVQGSSDAAVHDVVISSNLVNNSQDNGIAVRAILGDVYRVSVTGNTITDAGKAGIKYTMESGSSGTISNGAITGNTVTGFGIHVQQQGIVVCNFAETGTLTNVTVSGNTVIGIDSSGSSTGASGGIYMGASKNCNIVGNTCIGPFLLSGITVGGESIAVIGNVVTLAATDETYTYFSTLGGIQVYSCDRFNVSGNLVTNTGDSGGGAPGIILERANYGLCASNICFDDRLTPYQTYGIYETSAGGTSAKSNDNNFVGNYCHNNATLDIYLTGTRSTVSGNQIITTTVPVAVTVKPTLDITAVSTHATDPVVTTSAAHGMVAGDWVYITNITELAAGFYEVSAVTTTPAHTFTVSGTTTGTDTGNAQPCYTNRSPYFCDYIVSAGTVSKIEVSTDAGTTFTDTALTAGIFGLRYGDIICITNASAPTVVKVPKP